MVLIREANIKDLISILSIYNQGIEDRIATLETEPKDMSYIKDWFEQHQERYKIIVAEQEGKLSGWSSLNPYNNRCAYAGVADLSVYIAREYRGKGIGGLLLTEIEKIAIENDFHKIVLFTFPFNMSGQGLYKKKGYREVGIFKNQGILDGKYVDVMTMEKLIIQTK
ncbi:arsinothricin resistance N-acetyltransferase ArsN1 family A [Fredinandcohnia quinoae]|uniref:Arsinothricin resistance N-acetyltransferase ArsN1 n=1 Tax=Fredinandcohnia quinoae TaxID=2918902 RepID=A0AAW5E7H2_9BACI|nr:arsinothricin resistance N-acetyltransferase ArsN1 family A [Fredinandcohnia sp. SECRCQ15]MCH1627434.1 arsinothricin resistance N-acetyltransferase ArsN1 [Fredinandcohnia sp. SECRCQ15]